MEECMMPLPNVNLKKQKKQVVKSPVCQTYGGQKLVVKSPVVKSPVVKCPFPTSTIV